MVSESTLSSTELSEFFGPHWLQGRELSEFLEEPAKIAKLVIFFSLPEAPLPDPTQTPWWCTQHPETDLKRTETDPNGPKRTRNGPETDRNRPEMDRNQALWGGTAGGFVGMGWGWGL